MNRPVMSYDDDDDDDDDDEEEDAAVMDTAGRRSLAESALAAYTASGTASGTSHQYAQGEDESDDDDDDDDGGDGHHPALGRQHHSMNIDANQNVDGSVYLDGFPPQRADDDDEDEESDDEGNDDANSSPPRMAPYDANPTNSSSESDEEDEDNDHGNAIVPDAMSPGMASSHRTPDMGQDDSSSSSEELDNDHPHLPHPQQHQQQNGVDHEDDDDSDEENDDQENNINSEMPQMDQTQSSTQAATAAALMPKPAKSVKNATIPKKPGDGAAASKSRTTAPKTAASKPTPTKKQATPPTKKTPPVKKTTPGTSTPSSAKSPSGSTNKQILPSIDDPAPPLTDAEHASLAKLMETFCSVPHLGEFCFPVVQVHPELKESYRRVIKHPMDLSRVARTIRRRQYTSARAVQLDMWRIFANCVKFHTHPDSRDVAIQAFVSIALHLREFFNALWQEFMLPSDDMEQEQDAKKTTSKKDPTQALRQASMIKRKKERQERLQTTAVIALSDKCLTKAEAYIGEFLESRGCCDMLDQPLFNVDDEDEEEYVGDVVGALRELRTKLTKMADDPERVEYTVDHLDREMKQIYGLVSVANEKSSLFVERLRNRLDRLLGKIVVPIFEANGRGVSQSSVWGCTAAVIWARESSKKPYWPALVLGILAPEDQKEDWHQALTTRNEARLPEKLRIELQGGKRKAEQNIRRQSAGNAERMSFFLVEFMGTHEFTWVREADIIDNFNPDQDPNEYAALANKKKKKTAAGGSTAASGSKLLRKAIEEGRWALEEFDLQLNDPCGDASDEDNEGGGEGVEKEENYSYSILCHSDHDDEEDGGAGAGPGPGAGGDDDDTDTDEEGGGKGGTDTDNEEINELLATDGLLDFSAEGQRNAKKRAAARKKKQAEAQKAALKKEKAEQAKIQKELAQKAKMEEKLKKKKEAELSVKEKAKAKAESKALKKIAREKELESKREQKELEKRRKKRERERERYLKEEERKSKKARLASPEGAAAVPDSGARGRGGKRYIIPDKRVRASAIIRGYLAGLSHREEMRGLGLNGVSQMSIATVDSSSLLGMTVAFRAAAGVLDARSELPWSTMPWDRIDADTPQSSQERCLRLEEKIRLVENEVLRFKKFKRKLPELLNDAKKEKEVRERGIYEKAKQSKLNPLPTRKKYGPGRVSSEKKTQSASSSAMESNDMDDADAVEDYEEADEEEDAAEDVEEEEDDDDDDEHGHKSGVESAIASDEEARGGHDGEQEESLNEEGSEENEDVDRHDEEAMDEDDADDRCVEGLYNNNMEVRATTEQSYANDSGSDEEVHVPQNHEEHYEYNHAE